MPPVLGYKTMFRILLSQDVEKKSPVFPTLSRQFYFFLFWRSHFSLAASETISLYLIHLNIKIHTESGILYDNLIIWHLLIVMKNVLSLSSHPPFPAASAQASERFGGGQSREH